MEHSTGWSTRRWTEYELATKHGEVDLRIRARAEQKKNVLLTLPLVNKEFSGLSGEP